MVKMGYRISMTLILKRSSSPWGNVIGGKMKTGLNALADGTELSDSFEVKEPSLKFCIIGLAVVALSISGCSTSMIAYTPQAISPSQTLTYKQGVGTLSEKDNEREIVIYPTFKMQKTFDPTFTIGYANNSRVAVNFSTDNVRAYFRGQPVPIYTYTEKVSEIETEKTQKQVATAILGALVAGAAAYSASHQTYTRNYSASVYGGGRQTNFYGSNTLRVYDPMSGILAGSAVAGVTALGVKQIEFNAQSLVQASESILQQNTVNPQQMVYGNLILKNCCDPFSGPNDTVRFEVTTNGKMSSFEFIRSDGNKAPVRLVPVPASVPVAATTTPLQSSSGVTIPPPPPGQPPPPPLISQESVPLIPTTVIKSVAVPAASGTLASNRMQVGQLSYEAGELAKDLACNKYPVPVMNAKGPGFETYTVSCTNGDVLTLRCESIQNCRALQ